MGPMAVLCSSFIFSFILSASALEAFFAVRAVQRRAMAASFREAASDAMRLTSGLSLSHVSVVTTAVFHSALSFVIVVLSELMMLSKSDETRLRIAFVFAELRIVRVHCW